MMFSREMDCPQCGQPDGNHIDVIRTGARSEDETVVYSEQNLITGRHKTLESPDRYPEPPMSRRRHWVELDMWCELCGKTTTFTLAQHKGQTLVSWADRSQEAPK